MSKAKKTVSFKISTRSMFFPGKTLNVSEDFVTENIGTDEKLKPFVDSPVLIVTPPVKLGNGKGAKLYYRVDFSNVEAMLWVPKTDAKIH